MVSDSEVALFLAASCAHSISAKLFLLAKAIAWQPKNAAVANSSSVEDARRRNDIRKVLCSSEHSMDEPAVRTCGRVLSVPGAEGPETVASFVLDAEIVAHGPGLGIAFPPIGVPPLYWSTHMDMIIPFSGGPEDGGKAREARGYCAEAAAS